MIEDAPQLVITHLANIRGGPTQIGESGNSIGDGTARHLSRRPHHRVDLVGAILVDQRHRPGLGPDLLEKIMVDVGKNVDDGIADAEKLYVVIHGACSREIDRNQMGARSIIYY